MGPENRGPMTGRGMGRCSTGLDDFSAQGGTFGRGFGARGRGRGACRGAGKGYGRGSGQGSGQGFGQKGEDVSVLYSKIEVLESELKTLKENRP